MRIVVGETSTLVRSLIARTLQELGHEPEECATGDEVWAALTGAQQPDVALVSWELSGMTGPDICLRFRGLDRPAYTYLILLTARDDAEDIAHGLQSGADDYITKPVNAVELYGRLSVAERVLAFAGALRQANIQLDHLASTDSLTGIANRRVILQQLEEGMRECDRTGTPMAVLMIDVDRFKQFNNTYGHRAGDAVLTATGRTLVESVTPGHVGRYGGEEFLAVVPDAGGGGAFAAGERVRAAIAAMIVGTDGVFSVTASVGVCTLEPGQQMTPEGLLRAADTALYRAKKSGRNRTELALLADTLT